jgi:hypothetical protein
MRSVIRCVLCVGAPGGFGLDGLLSGQFRVLLPGEVHALRKAAEVRPKPKASVRARPATKKEAMVKNQAA